LTRPALLEPCPDRCMGSRPVRRRPGG